MAKLEVLTGFDGELKDNLKFRQAMENANKAMKTRFKKKKLTPEQMEGLIKPSKKEKK